MNGYQMTADSYRQLLESDKYPDIDREAIQHKIKALDFLATATEEERLELFNSSAFNDVVKGYLKMAVDNIELEEEEREEVRQKLLNEFRYLFDTVTAKQAEEYYNNH